MKKDGAEVIGGAVRRMMAREVMESKASCERVENGGEDGSSRKIWMSVEGSKEVLLVSVVEYG
jgi:hypothetical protein